MIIPSAVLGLMLDQPFGRGFDLLAVALRIGRIEGAGIEADVIDDVGREVVDQVIEAGGDGGIFLGCAVDQQGLQMQGGGAGGMAGIAPRAVLVLLRTNPVAVELGQLPHRFGIGLLG